MDGFVCVGRGSKRTPTQAALSMTSERPTLMPACLDRLMSSLPLSLPLSLSLSLSLSLRATRSACQVRLSLLSCLCHNNRNSSCSSLFLFIQMPSSPRRAVHEHMEKRTKIKDWVKNRLSEVSVFTTLPLATRLSIAFSPIRFYVKRINGLFPRRSKT